MLREILFINKDVIHQLEKVQSRLEEHDNQILAKAGFAAGLLLLIDNFVPQPE